MKEARFFFGLEPLVYFVFESGVGSRGECGSGQICPAARTMYTELLNTGGGGGIVTVGGDIGAKALVSYRQQVERMSSDARAQLRAWTEIDRVTDFKAYHEMALKLGDLEGIPLLIKMARVIQDDDGAISDAEYSVFCEVGQKIVDTSLSIALNAGVVGALILSILIPIAMVPAELNEDGWFFVTAESLEFTILEWILRAFFLGCLSLATAFAIQSVFLATLISCAVSTWCSSLEAKVYWHMDRLTVIRSQMVLVWRTFQTLSLTIWAGGLMCGPLQGVLTILPFLTHCHVTKSIFDGEIDYARNMLHDDAKRLFLRAETAQGETS